MSSESMEQWKRLPKLPNLDGTMLYSKILIENKPYKDHIKRDEINV